VIIGPKSYALAVGYARIIPEPAPLEFLRQNDITGVTDDVYYESLGVKVKNFF
jgi:hypothetical protein